MFMANNSKFCGFKWSIWIRSFVIFILLGAASCGGGGSDSQSQISRSGEFSFSSPVSQVASRIDDFIFVDVMVNNSPAVFILDTGADAFVVTTELAARLGLVEIGATQIVTIAGTSDAPLYRIDDFQFGSVVGRRIDAAALDLSGFDGIVGVPFFREVLVGVDYGSGVIELADPDFLSIEQAALENGATVLSAKRFELDGVFIEGLDVGRVRIDTGSSGGLRVSGMRAAPVLSEKDKTLRVISTASNGRVPGTAFIADDLTFGRFSLPEQLVVAQDGGLEVGLMGSLVLRQFYWIFDYRSSRIAMRQDRDLRYGLREPDELSRMRHASLLTEGALP